MQSFSSVHLQHLNNTFAAMTKVSGKTECAEQIELLSQSLKAEFETQLQQQVDSLSQNFQSELNNLSQTLQSELNKIAATQTQAISSFTQQYTKNLVIQAEEDEFILDSKFKRLEDKITAIKPEETLLGIKNNIELNFNYLSACIAEQNQRLSDLQLQITQSTQSPVVGVETNSKISESFTPPAVVEKAPPKLEQKQPQASSKAANIKLASCSQYFSKLPWRSDLMTAEVKEKLAKPSEDATKMMQLATESALQAAASVSAPVESVKDSHLEASTDFLNSDAGSANENVIVSKTETATPLKLSDKNSQLYFQALPWNTKSSLSSSAIENNEEFLEPENSFSESETSFLDAEKEEVEAIVDLDIIESEEPFETLDFNEIVTAKTKADAGTNAQTYFKTLPWTRTDSKQIDTESAKIERLESSIDLNSSFMDELPEEEAFTNSEELFLDAEETEMDLDLSFAESGESTEPEKIESVESSIDLGLGFIEDVSEESEELFLDAAETEMDFDLSFAESEEGSENLSFNATENTQINKNTNAQTYFKSLPWAA